MDFYQALKDPKAAPTIYLFDGLHLTLLAIGRKVPSEVSCFPCWKMCLLPLAQPSGNNISHTERSWCQGQLSCKRRGRWETCIDFSFCWGKQAWCSWARVQWGRHNVLDCSSSLSPVSCDCWETPWKQLSPKKKPYENTINMYFFFFSNLFEFKTAWNARGNNPSDYIIPSKESWWRKFGRGSRDETQPASPQIGMSCS